MDLIFANTKREDLGILHDYDMDLAYGKDENSFELSMPIKNHACEKGYIVYVEDSEYGGIVDSLKVDTASKTITYKGRTWHGILEGHILEPDKGKDYLVLSGDANEVIGTIIKRIGLTDIFKASTEPSHLIINKYKCRYQDVYTVLKDMLSSVTGKLIIRYKKGTVELSAVPYIDYSQDEEWDSTQLSFIVEENYRPINHLVCLGKGDLKDRYVIHLFVSENGAIQPYTKKAVPLMDSDYILDKSKQVLFGDDEVSAIYDRSNSQTTENYVLLLSEPEEWETVFKDYYQEVDGKMKNLDMVDRYVYTLQKTQPSDWTFNYDDYFKAEGSEYVNVADAGTKVYTGQTWKPSDWTTNYKSYYVKSGNNYVNVSSITKNGYGALDKQPVDWATNYEQYFMLDGSDYINIPTSYYDVYDVLIDKPEDWDAKWFNYYRRVASSEEGAVYERIKSLPQEMEYIYEYDPVTEQRYIVGKRPTGHFVFDRGRYYKKTTFRSEIPFEEGAYYRPITYQSHPEWQTGTYYTMSINNIPEWQAGTFYTKSVQKFPPTYIKGAYYKKVFDNYAELVKDGIQELRKSYNCNSIKIIFDAKQEYDIGDIVGATEHTTGISVWQPITKKIVKIVSGTEQIDYEIGE